MYNGLTMRSENVVTIVNVKANLGPAMFRLATFLDIPKTLTWISFYVIKQGHSMLDMHASDTNIMLVIAVLIERWIHEGAFTLCVQQRPTGNRLASGTEGFQMSFPRCMHVIPVATRGWCESGTEPQHRE